MNKRKIISTVILSVFILFILFFLTGCKSKPVDLEIMISAPTNQVNKGDGIDVNGLNVYALQNTGTVKLLSRHRDYTLVFEEVEQINGVSGYRNVVKVYAKYFHVDKQLQSEPIYLVKNAETAVLPKPIFNFSYHEVNFPKNKSRIPGKPNNTNRFVFMTGLGQAYDIDSFRGQYGEYGFSVKMLYGKTPGSVKSGYLSLNDDNIKTYQESLDEQLKINPHVKKINNELKLEPIYPHYYGKDGIKKGGFGSYRMYFFVKEKAHVFTDDIKKEKIEVLLNADEEFLFSHPVYSLSIGERPLSKKAANWFDYILVIPIASIMWLFGFAGSLGLAVFFTTIVVRTLAWPIYAKTNNMSFKMQEAQPDLRKIQNKYKGRTDKQSQRAMQMEMMQVYRKHKIGFSSFLLMFLQMPIFIAMYQAVRRVYLSDGMFSTKFTRVTNVMGFIDFTQGGLKFVEGGFNYITFILAILVGVTMFLLQFFGAKKPKYLKQHNEQPTEQMKKQQRTTKIISFVMLIMMVIFSFQNNGIAFYWICGNLYSLAQTFIQGAINKKKYLKKHQKTGLEV